MAGITGFGTRMRAGALSANQHSWYGARYG